MRARVAGALLLAAAAALPPRIGVAQYGPGQPRVGGAPPSDLPPVALEQVGIEEKLGNRIPLDTRLVDWRGSPYRLGSVFDGERPVVMALVYYECPMLCGLILSGMSRAMRENGLVLGKDYRAVTISFDPEEKPQQAAERRRGYLQSLGASDAGEEWPFTVGEAAATRAVADAVGFSYAKDPVSGEWAHLAAIFVLTPDGRVSRYLYGIEYPPKDFRLAVVEAAGGKVGTSFDQILLTCYRYDPASRKYEPYALGILRLGGAVVLGALVLLIGGLVWRERRGKARQPR